MSGRKEKGEDRSKKEERKEGGKEAERDWH